jgi:uncharacterized protein YkwD
MKQLYNFIIIFILLVFVACDESDLEKFGEQNTTIENNNTNTIIENNNTNTNTISQTNNENTNTSLENNKTNTTIDIIKELNTLRTNSGLISLKTNKLLKQSSLNHTNYLVDINSSGHYETKNLSNFYTGDKPVDRTLNVGYKSRSVSENLSVGQATELLSLDGLMGAIYHRFGFLSFSIDEIGYAKDNKTYVYNMGNSYLNTLCNDNNFTSNGTYYKSVCQDESFRIEASVYESAKNGIINQNPKYVIYPYKNQKDVTPVFYEESPDPLPNHSVSGYPISVEFNENDFTMSGFILDSFTLRDANYNSIALIRYNDLSYVMTKENNAHSDHWSENQFAIFPEKRLDFNTTYSVELSYTHNSNSETINWDFTTKSLPNLIIYDNNSEDISLELDKTYYIYFKPNSATETIDTFSISYSYNSPSDVIITKSIYDKNTLKLKLSGQSLLSAKIKLNGDVYDNKEINIKIIK